MPSIVPLNDRCFYPDHVIGGVCSGRGTCNSSTMRCECDAGFSSRNDWVNLDGMSCSTSDIAVRVLWAAVLVLWITNVPVVVNTTKLQWGSCKGSSFVEKLTDGLKSRPQFAFMVCESILGSLVILCSIAKVAGNIAFNNGTIAGQVFLILAGMSSGVFYIVTMLTLQMQTNIALKGMGGGDKDKVEKIKAVLKYLIPKIPIDFLILNVTSFVAALSQENGAVVIVLYVCFFWRTFSLMFSLFGVLGMKLSVETAFAGVKTEPGDKLDTLKKAIGALVKDSTKALLITGTLFLVTAAYKKAWGTWVYGAPFSLLLMVLFVKGANKLFGSASGGKKGKKVGP
jgi:hypothetical protein